MIEDVAMQLPLPMVHRLQELSKTRDLTPTARTELREKAWRWYTTMLVNPGEMIGATAAANFGEPATQAALRAFHSGGKANVPTVNRLRQLLELSKGANENPRTRFYLKEGFNTEENAQKLARFCTNLTVDNAADSIVYDQENYTLTVIIREDVQRIFDLDLEYVAERIDHVIKPIPGVRVGTGKVLDSSAYPIVIQSLEPTSRALVLLKEQLEEIQIAGLENAGGAFVEEQDGEWTVIIRGPKTEDSIALWDDLHSLLAEYIDETRTETSSVWVIFNKFGLEAALNAMTNEVWEQMNGIPGKVRGLGPLDYRYIRTVVDAMGTHGLLTAHGKSGSMVKLNPSMIGAMGGEDIMMSLQPGAIMGNIDPLKGMVESIAAGKALNIGLKYRRKTQS